MACPATAQQLPQTPDQVFIGFSPQISDNLASALPPSLHLDTVEESRSRKTSCEIPDSKTPLTPTPPVSPDAWASPVDCMSATFNFSIGCTVDGDTNGRHTTQHSHDCVPSKRKKKNSKGKKVRNSSHPPIFAQPKSEPPLSDTPRDPTAEARKKHKQSSSFPYKRSSSARRDGGKRRKKKKTQSGMAIGGSKSGGMLLNRFSSQFGNESWGGASSIQDFVSNFSYSSQHSFTHGANPSSLSTLSNVGFPANGFSDDHLALSPALIAAAQVQMEQSMTFPDTSEYVHETQSTQSSINSALTASTTTPPHPSNPNQILHSSPQIHPSSHGIVIDTNFNPSSTVLSLPTSQLIDNDIAVTPVASTPPFEELDASTLIPGHESAQSPSYSRSVQVHDTPDMKASAVPSKSVSFAPLPPSDIVSPNSISISRNDSLFPPMRAGETVKILTDDDDVFIDEEVPFDNFLAALNSGNVKIMTDEQKHFEYATSARIARSVSYGDTAAFSAFKQASNSHRESLPELVEENTEDLVSPRDRSRATTMEGTQSPSSRRAAIFSPPPSMTYEPLNARVMSQVSPKRHHKESNWSMASSRRSSSSWNITDEDTEDSSDDETTEPETDYDTEPESVSSKLSKMSISASNHKVSLSGNNPRTRHSVKRKKSTRSLGNPRRKSTKSKKSLDSQATLPDDQDIDDNSERHDTVIEKP